MGNTRLPWFRMSCRKPHALLPVLRLYGLSFLHAGGDQGFVEGEPLAVFPVVPGPPDQKQPRANRATGGHNFDSRLAQ